MQPLIDAGPAVEVAAESDDRFMRKVQTDIAVEATIEVLGC